MFLPYLTIFFKNKIIQISMLIQNWLHVPNLNWAFQFNQYKHKLICRKASLLETIWERLARLKYLTALEFMISNKLLGMDREFN